MRSLALCTAPPAGTARGMDSVDTLREAVTQRERELADLRARLAAAEAAAETAATAAAAAATATPAETVLEEPAAAETAPSWQWPLEDHEYERYGRQMVVPGFGLEGERPAAAPRPRLRRR